MFAFSTKFLKIALPLTTLTAATIITATLLFSSREDIKLTNLNEEALENYEKELDPYEEELMKQADEPQEDKSKENESGEDENKDKSDEDTGKQKSLDELIKQKLDGVDGKEAVQKLLNNPEQLVEDILKGSGIEKPDQQQKDQVLQKLKESADQLAKNKEKEVPSSPQEQKPKGQLDAESEELHTSGGEEKELPPAPASSEPDSLQEHQEEDRENEKLKEQTPNPPQEESESTLKQVAKDQVDGDIAEEEEEALGERLEEDSLSSPSEQEDQVLEGPQEKGPSGEKSQEDGLAENDFASDSQEDFAGGDNESDGGDSDETIVDMEKLNWFDSQLKGAMSSLRLKLG